MYIQPALVAPAQSDHDEVEAEEGASGEGEDDEHTHTPAHHESSADYIPLPRPSAALIFVVALGLIATIALGVYPAPLLELVEAASAAIIPGG